jgi:hypothetical protein
MNKPKKAFIKSNIRLRKYIKSEHRVARWRNVSNNNPGCSKFSKADCIMARCPELETGRNSVTP